MRIVIPEALRGKAFSVADGLAIGLGEGRMRGPDLEKPFWGVRSSQRDMDVAALASACMTRMPTHAFFSHTTAAQLWKIPLPLELERPLPLHVSVPTDLRGPTGAGIRGHHLQVDDRDIRMLHGRPVTTLERTVFDLAAILDDESLLAALDNIMWHRRRSGLRATQRSAAASFSRFTGRRGRARLLELMPLATGRSDSPPESAFRLRFLRAGFPAPLPNESIMDAAGWPVATPDLQFRDFRMAFDYEGDGHRTDKSQWRKDLARVPRIQDLGWHHTRISGNDLDNPTELLTRTRRLLLERGWHN